MGARNKLLLELGGRTVLEHAVGSVLEAGITDVIVVTGAEAERVRDLLTPYEVRVVYNEAYDEGMGSSLRAGVSAVDESAVGIGVLPGDMPFVRAATISVLSSSLRPNSIVAPLHQGLRGHPVFFGQAFRADLLGITGDEGARGVIDAHRDALVTVDTNDAGILRDIDTHADYRSAREKRPRTCASENS